MGIKVLLLLLVLCLLPWNALADGRAFYEIFPASFYDGNGDGKGDLPGIIEKLDYLEDLGVEGVWLTPIHPSPSYHKYDVMDYRAVDASFGTVADVEALAAALHEKGMALLLDLVINHTSNQHPWFVEACAALAAGKESPFIDYYNFSDQPVPGWRTVPGVPGWCYEGCFSENMPDLNLDSETVRQEILDICRFWMEKGVDGFRLDAVLYYYSEDTARNTAFLAWLMEKLRAINPDVYVVGEVWKDAGTIARHYESGISSLFNFPFSGAEGAIVKAIRDKKGASFAQKAADWQKTWSAFPDASDAMFLSNHDIARIAGTLMRKPDALKLAASMYLLLPGTPFLYYGEEIGMTGSGRDENKRLPMLWSEADTLGSCLPPANADQQSQPLGSVEAQLGDPGSLLNHYRALLSLRKEYPALRDGVITPLDMGNAAVCAYALSGDGQTVYVLHNLGKNAVSLAWEYAPVAVLNDPVGQMEYADGMLSLPANASVLAVQ